MTVNKHVVVATVVILAGGVLRAWLTHSSTITRTVLGGLVFMFVLSVIDVFGGGLSTLASALAMLAMITVLWTDILPLLLHSNLFAIGRGG